MPPVPAAAVKWVAMHGVTSNVAVAHLSNVCREWRRIVHQVLLEQAQEDDKPLLLLASMLRYLMNMSQLEEDEKETDATTNVRVNVPRNATFCAAWFHPDGIREVPTKLHQPKDEELESIEEQVQSRLLQQTSTFEPNGTINNRTNDMEGQLAISNSLSSPDGPPNCRTVVDDNNYFAMPTNYPRMNGEVVTTTDEWRGYRTAMDVLQHFGYQSSFVQDLIECAVRECGSDTDILQVEDVFSCHQPTFSVRGATVARPESYCLCEDADLNIMFKAALRQDNNNDSEIAQIRLQEFHESLTRKEQRRRELRRQVLPRVVWGNPHRNGRQNRCVQFLNAAGSHAVCMLTPPFACGPIQEPVTVFCVAIATEDACFLSGLHHCFELGHLYPETETLETTERSSICLATEVWNSDCEERHSGHHRLMPKERTIPADNHLRFSLSDDSSYDASEAEGSCGNPKCTCVFRGVSSKLDEIDANGSRHIHRGRFGPGSWHCYTAIFDGQNSEIRIDGVAEPINHNSTTRGYAALDGLTLGSDHCFGVSLCCGQPGALGGQGEGAIAEVAVFSGRLQVADLECIEEQLMERHGIHGTSWQDNAMERHAETMYLWPPPEDEPPPPVPLRFMTRHRSVAWHQVHPVTGERISISRIGARNGATSSDW